MSTAEEPMKVILRKRYPIYPGEGYIDVMKGGKLIISVDCNNRAEVFVDVLKAIGIKIEYEENDKEASMNKERKRTFFEEEIGLFQVAVELPCEEFGDE